ncbi:MAG: helicase [Thermoleophilia bacterium]|nr:helicase [Thermoleophilia bacterium]
MAVPHDMLALRASLGPDDLVSIWAEPATGGERSGPTLEVTAAQFVDEIVPLVDEPPAGVRVGADLRMLVRLARRAAAVVVRQEYVPDVRFERAGNEGTRLVGRWSPLPRTDLRNAIDADLREAQRVLAEPAHAGREDGDLALPVVVQARHLVANVVDELVRARIASDPPRLVAATPGGGETLHDRWLRALTCTNPVIDGPDDGLDRLAADVSEWQHRLRSDAESPWRLVLRLEEPDEPASAEQEHDEPWTLRYLVQLRSDPSVLVAAADAWSPSGPDKAALARHGFHAGQHLLAPLAQAAQLFEPIADSLGAAQPAMCELTTPQAHAFLASVAPLLEQSGFAVAVPAWWTRGRPKISLRAAVVSDLHGGRQHMDSLNLATLVGYDWRAAVGDAELTRDELTRLAAQKSPLVRVRGRWMELDERSIRTALAHVERAGDAPRFATVADLVRMSVGAADDVDGVPVTGVDGGDIAELLEQVQRHETPDRAAVPAGVDATLRPYQERGFQWLATMSDLGLGACLADDMGLGKTLQVLALVQHHHERDAAVGVASRPTLVVCPTSVLTNWLHEAGRFTPDLSVVVHHGPGRLRDERFLEAASARSIVFTSYAVLARDVETLRAVGWRTVVLDEAQNIKNPGTRHARAARSIAAPTRIALTGTPVENHAGDLWSIMEFLNPGLLGSQVDFRRKYLVPIQTGTFPEAATRLRQIVAPFLLRRVKTDRAVIADLPDKFEHVAWASLTTEQASLYEAIVREAADTLRMARGTARRSGIERRGLILATIAKLKQACNHPAQLLADGSRIAGRSGKLARLEGLLETVLDQGERALVFTQFVAMGRLLQQQLADTFGREVLFLHGGTSRAERDRIVERFQDPGAGAPPILVLSLKAGGSGLNLTAATHVFHFDRWWNPATEQQATDRAFRIGQERDVQVHALVCAGTVEERIDLMLRQKRGVADSVIGSGEQWITELEDAELLDLLTLRRDTMLQDGTLDHLDPKEWVRGSL